VAGEQQQPDEPDDLLVVEALAVPPGPQQFAGQVLASVGPAAAHKITIQSKALGHGCLVGHPLHPQAMQNEQLRRGSVGHGPEPYWPVRETLRVTKLTLR
jgi:hypothetical protein